MVDDESLDHEYLPILGLEGFRKASAKLILGADSKAIAEGRVGAAQCISGTGAVFTGAQFLSRHYPIKGAACYISNPTWGKSLYSFMFTLMCNSFTHTLDVVFSFSSPSCASKYMRTLFFLYFISFFSFFIRTFSFLLHGSLSLSLSLVLFGHTHTHTAGQGGLVPLNYAMFPFQLSRQTTRLLCVIIYPALFFFSVFIPVGNYFFSRPDQPQQTQKMNWGTFLVVIAS